jgi:hypothetical protein
MDPYQAETGVEQHNVKYETLSHIEEEGRKFAMSVTALEFRSAQNPKFTANTVEEESAVAQRNSILYPPYFIQQGD